MVGQNRSRATTHILRRADDASTSTGTLLDGTFLSGQVIHMSVWLLLSPQVGDIAGHLEVRKAVFVFFLSGSGRAERRKDSMEVLRDERHKIS